MTPANQTPRIITITTPGPQGPQGPPGVASSGSNTYIGDQIITGSILISGSIIPAVGTGELTSSFSLGSPDAAWKDIYVSNGSIKFIQSGSQAVILSAVNGGISIDGGSVISADGVSGQFITSKSLDTTITVKDYNNSLLMGPIDIETDKEIIVEEGSDLTIFGDIENTTPDDLSIRTLNVNSTTTLNGTLTVSNNISASGKVNSAFYTNNKDINSDVFINNNESALIIGETTIEEDKEISIEDDSELTIFGDIEITNVATADTALFAISASYTDTSSYAVSASYASTSSYATSASFSDSSSYTISASYVNNTTSASYASTSSYATSASYASYTDSTLTSSYAVSSSYAPLPYKSYIALFTCAVDNDPVVNVIENTLGDTVEWVNSGPNTSIKLNTTSNVFTPNKTYYSLNLVGRDTSTPMINIIQNNYSEDSLQIFPYDLSGSLNFDIGDSSIDLFATIEIKVFP